MEVPRRHLLPLLLMAEPGYKRGSHHTGRRLVGFHVLVGKLTSLGSADQHVDVQVSDATSRADSD